MLNNKKIIIIISIFGLISVIFSCWFGYYPIALFIGIISIIIGVKIFKLANLKFDIVFYLCLQIFFLCAAFSFLYIEKFGLSFINSMTLSFQYLFHVSIVSVPDKIEKSALFKIFASFESFIGYILIISGVGLMIKNDRSTLP